MPLYYVNKNPQANGDHEVHTTGCPHPPDPRNRVPLGNHPSCRSAMVDARAKYDKADGCKWCCPKCNTR
jgi:hypothetical protein